EVTLFVPRHDALKICRVRLRNQSREARRLSATAYVEWVLGPSREGMASFVITARDDASGAVTARNPYNVEFAGQAAFLAASPAPSSATGDRAAFLGRLGSLRRPAALDERELDGRFGAGLDPCGALRCSVELAPGGEGELIILLGQGADLDEAR